MPRAHRHYIPGCVWHITHRCHKQEFLFKFDKDKRRWCHWLFEAKKRYGLCVLNYIVTSNHIHLLVVDTDENTIAKSLQLIAGRTAQEYNNRKKRKGAFWEDRYHATAIQPDEHLAKCMVYIDLNMVRAGVIKHPSEQSMSGYYEIQNQPDRYRIIDIKTSLDYFSIKTEMYFKQAHHAWVDEELKKNQLQRDDRWSQAIAMGNQAFIDNIHDRLNTNVAMKNIMTKEATAAYNTLFEGEKWPLMDTNSYYIKITN